MTGDALPLASLSLDLDNLWAYLRTHGDSGWETFPSYLGQVVPPVLDLLQERALTITFFVVGQDACMPVNHEALTRIAAAGHEIANHSHRHEPWLHRYSRTELHEELGRAEEAIEAATGRHPSGFRGPGYSLSPTVLSVLAERGYAYDASTLPTPIGPLARAYYFRSARLHGAQREERRYLFGTWRDGLRPLRPYVWSVEDTGTATGGGRLTELPVTTMPVLRIPFHFSYLLHLAGTSPAAATRYLRAGLRLCRLRKVEPSLLLHPLDVLGGDEVDGLRFFPGMGLPGAAKRDLVAGWLDVVTSRFRVVTTADHAARLTAAPAHRTRLVSAAGASPGAARP